MDDDSVSPVAHRAAAFDRFALTLLHQRPVQTVVLRSVDSTNRLARSIVEAVAADSTVERPFALLAWCQEAGRGRVGRSWQSDAGKGVYLSLYWPDETCANPSSTQAPSDFVVGLPLRVGCALQRALVGLGVSVRLKWPNDLMAGGRKLGGILIELMREPGGHGAVIGVGINVEHDATQVFPGATSLSVASGRQFITAEVARSVLHGLVAELVRDRDLAEIADEYRAASAHRTGDRIRWRSPRGERKGTFRGIADDGSLLLESAAGVEAIHAGEILVGERSGDGP